MPADLPPGPDSPPTDELDSAEATLAVLQHVLHGIANDDWSKQTPCREFDVAGLTDHLMNSITVSVRAAGAQLPERDRADSVERQVVARGTTGAGRMASPRAGRHRRRSVRTKRPPSHGGILSLEFLVHAWDYAKRSGAR